MAILKIVQAFEIGEEQALAELWHEAWHFAHRDLVAPGLADARTRESFRQRLLDLCDNTLVAWLDDVPAGFSMIRHNELYQFFLAPAARGMGVAAPLIEATEDLLVSRGAAEAFLYCAKGNERARGFYEKCGWRDDGIVDVSIEGAGEIYAVPCHVFRKSLAENVTKRSTSTRQGRNE